MCMSQEFPTPFPLKNFFRTWLLCAKAIDMYHIRNSSWKTKKSWTHFNPFMYQYNWYIFREKQQAEVGGARREMGAELVGVVRALFLRALTGLLRSPAGSRPAAFTQPCPVSSWPPVLSVHQPGPLLRTQPQARVYIPWTVFPVLLKIFKFLEPHI
jgi:hypothetical protein